LKLNCIGLQDVSAILKIQKDYWILNIFAIYPKVEEDIM
jgi:hypothetical protein